MGKLGWQFRRNDPIKNCIESSANHFIEATAHYYCSILAKSYPLKRKFERSLCVLL